jgi:hypothetical protein
MTTTIDWHFVDRGPSDSFDTFDFTSTGQEETTSASLKSLTWYVDSKSATSPVYTAEGLGNPGRKESWLWDKPSIASTVIKGVKAKHGRNDTTISYVQVNTWFDAYAIMDNKAFARVRWFDSASWIPSHSWQRKDVVSSDYYYLGYVGDKLGPDFGAQKQVLKERYPNYKLD